MIPRQKSNNSQEGMHGGSWRECLLAYLRGNTYIQTEYIVHRSTYMHSRAAEDGRAYRICSDILLCTQINTSLFLAC